MIKNNSKISAKKLNRLKALALLYKKGIHGFSQSFNLSNVLHWFKELFNEIESESISPKPEPPLPEHVDKYYKGKDIIDKILSDQDVVKKIQQFILTERGRGSKEYISTYSKIDDIIKSITQERLVIIKSDGQFYYDSSLDVYTATIVFNHNSRPEVAESLNFLYGNKNVNKTALINNYPKELKSLIFDGYGIATRSSSTTKTIQSYVAKTYSDDMNPLNIDIFTLRVSIPNNSNDGNDSNNDTPLNKVNTRNKINNKTIKPRKVIVKPEWYDNGPTNMEETMECATYILNGTRGSG
jgi:hypothetical protein